MEERRSELTKPDWFDLEKYKDLSDFSAINWAALLTQRLFLYDGRYGPPSRQYGLSIKEIVKLRGAMFDSIEEDPLNPYPFDFGEEIPSLLLDFQKYGEELYKGKKYSKLFQKNIEPLTMGQAFEFQKFIPGEAKTAFENNTDNEVSEDSIYNHYFRKPIDASDRFDSFRMNTLVHICVNLSAPDKQIVKDFSNFLKEARKLTSHSLRIKFNRNLLKRLCDNKVLPYLDLILWADRVFDEKILYRKLAIWLYLDDVEDEFDAVDRIRKVTNPLAEKAMEYEFIEAVSKIKE